jgi:hypothetical protein
MNDKPIKKEEEQSQLYEKVDGKGIYLDLFIKFLIQRCIGKALDEARISPMTDRQLTQYSRTVKDEFYKTAEYGAKILESYGYESGEKHE